MSNLQKWDMDYIAKHGKPTEKQAVATVKIAKKVSFIDRVLNKILG